MGNLGGLSDANGVLSEKVDEPDGIDDMRDLLCLGSVTCDTEYALWGAENSISAVPDYMNALCIEYRAEVMHAVNVILDLYPDGVTEDSPAGVLDVIHGFGLTESLNQHLRGRMLELKILLQ